MSLPGLYIHVPFCRSKCPYCGFYSITSQSLIPRWLDALKREILLYKDQFSKFDSLYLGGGTPSILEIQQIDEIIRVVTEHFKFADDTETTIEANPGDITKEKARGLKYLGFNRINLGIQSFDNNELNFLGRRHKAGTAERALEILKSSGLNNIGIDLIYGYDGQSLACWMRSLKKALSFDPMHISCYQLTFEKKTVFWNRKEKGEILPLDQDEESEFFLTTSNFLVNNGYIHYEISNFAKKEEVYSHHNCKYWNHTPYLGLGPSAHSFKDYMRWWNFSSIKRYCRNLKVREYPVKEKEVLTDEQFLLEALSLGLRTSRGFDIKLLQGIPDKDEVINSLEESGYIIVSDDHVVPTKKGFLVADHLPLVFIQ